MTSLVLMQRIRQNTLLGELQHVYLDSGSSQDLVAKLRQNAILECKIEVVADLPRMGHALEAVKSAFGTTPDYDGWYKISTSVALQALSVCYGAQPKTPAPCRLHVEDRTLMRDLLDGLRANYRQAKETQLCQADRTLLNRLCDQMRRGEFETQLCQGDRMLLFQMMGRLDAMLNDGVDMNGSQDDVNRHEGDNDINDDQGSEVDSSSSDSEDEDGCLHTSPQQTTPSMPAPPLFGGIKRGFLLGAGEATGNETAPEQPAAPTHKQRGTTDEHATATQADSSWESANWYEPTTQLDEFEAAAVNDASNADDTGEQTPCAEEVIMWPHQQEGERVPELKLPQIASFGAMLVPCAKQDAQPAALVKKTLRENLGEKDATNLLANYTQKVLRDNDGKNQRYWVDAAGALVRLAHLKNVAP